VGEEVTGWLLVVGAVAGWAGLVASVLSLFNQDDILATAVPGFPVFDLAASSAARCGPCG